MSGLFSDQDTRAVLEEASRRPAAGPIEHITSSEIFLLAVLAIIAVGVVAWAVLIIVREARARRWSSALRLLNRLSE